MSQHAVWIEAQNVPTAPVVGMPVGFVCGPEETGGEFCLSVLELDGPVGPPLHQHPWRESYYILSGTVEMTVDGSTRRLSAGDFVTIPGNTPHTVIGTGAPAKALIWANPAGAHAFLRDLSESIRVIPEDCVRLPEVAARHQVEIFVGVGER